MIVKAALGQATASDAGWAVAKAQPALPTAPATATASTVKEVALNCLVDPSMQGKVAPLLVATIHALITDYTEMRRRAQG